MAAVEKFVDENLLMMPIYSILTPYPGTTMYKEYKAKSVLNILYIIFSIVELIID
jgi:bacteriochlorophyll C8 methyltransferase